MSYEAAGLPEEGDEVLVFFRDSDNESPRVFQRAQGLYRDDDQFDGGYILFRPPGRESKAISTNKWVMWFTLAKWWVE